jgi:hypothetical protein
LIPNTEVVDEVTGKSGDGNGCILYRRFLALSSVDDLLNLSPFGLYTSRCYGGAQA